jgi:hypothetical protein
MKVYRKVVIDVKSGEDIYEDSFEYSGSVALCKGGGGGGGGTGAVDWPDYMETFQGQMLDHAGADTPTSSYVDLFNAAIAANPFTGVVAYDPATRLAAIEGAITSFDSVVSALSETTDWGSFVAVLRANTSSWATLASGVRVEIDAYMVDKETLNDEIDAYAAELDDQLHNVSLPRFEAGMRDIGAVVSSAFSLGRAHVIGMRDRDVARFSSELYRRTFEQRNELIVRGTQAAVAIEDIIARNVQQLIAMEELRVKYSGVVAGLSVESGRMSMIAEKEEADRQAQIDEIEARWSLNMLQYGANLLASIGGGVVSEDEATPFQSALGGAASGAAMGLMLSGGNPWGALVGGGMGLGMALLE